MLCNFIYRRRSTSSDGDPSPAPARLVFMGAGRVGTTSLIKQFTMGYFHETHRAERAKVMRHTKQVTSSRLKCDVTVQLWDVEGGDRHTAMHCARRAHAVAVVYDVTNRSSFETAQNYLDHINPRASSLLIGNKCDLGNFRKVSIEEGRLLARIHRVKYMETSAKEKIHIKECFTVLVDCVPEEYLTQCKGKVKSQAARRWRVSTAAVCMVCKSNISHKVNDKHIPHSS